MLVLSRKKAQAARPLGDAAALVDGEPAGDEVGDAGRNFSVANGPTTWRVRAGGAWPSPPRVAEDEARDTRKICGAPPAGNRFSRVGQEDCPKGFINVLDWRRRGIDHGGYDRGRWHPGEMTAWTAPAMSSGRDRDEPSRARSTRRRSPNSSLVKQRVEAARDLDGLSRRGVRLCGDGQIRHAESDLRHLTTSSSAMCSMNASMITTELPIRHYPNNS